MTAQLCDLLRLYVSVSTGTGMKALFNKTRRRALLRSLDTLRERHDPTTEPQAWLAALNRLLKVSAMRSHPGEGAGSLTGEAWVGFLGDQDLSVLATGPYRPAPEFDAEMLEAAARRWLHRHG